MLVWAAIALAVLGVTALLADLHTAEYFRAHVQGKPRQYARMVTDIAKGAHWLGISVALFGLAQAWIAAEGETPWARRASEITLALLVSMVISSGILHTLKLVLGRRRPRDHFQHGLSGVQVLAFDTRYDSFPSGHAVTIFCVATVASGAWPVLAPLWFGLAAFLALTRALLTSHYLSDVLFGAALGLIVAREVMVLMYPQLAPSWF